MKVAWAASMLAEALLLAALLRSGRRGWWEAYLGADLARCVVLWPLYGSPSAYWWAWVITAVIVAVFQIAAALQAVSAVRLREVVHIGLICGVSVFVWAMLLSDEAWVVARRAPLLFEQAVSFGCAGALLAPMAYGDATDSRMAAYFVSRAGFSIAAQISGLSVFANTLYLWGLCVGFGAWAVSILGVNFGRIRQ